MSDAYDEAICTALRDIERNSTTDSKTLAAYLFKAVGVTDGDFTECYFCLKNSYDHHKYAWPLTCRILRQAGCAGVFKLDEVAKQLQGDTPPTLPKLALRELVAVVAREIAAESKNTIAKKFVQHVSRIVLKMNPDRFGFNLEGILNLFETAENKCLISPTDVTPLCSWLKCVDRQDLASKVLEQSHTLPGQHPIPGHLKEFPVGTPPRGEGEPTLQTPHGMQQPSSSVTMGFRQPPTTMTTQDPVPATPCQSSGGQPHFSRGDRHMYSHHPSASAHTPQPVPSTSSLPLQGSNLQPQHSLGSYSARAPGYPPGINTSTPLTVPGGTDMSQMHYPGNPSFQSQHSRGSNGSYQGFPQESSSFSSVGSGRQHPIPGHLKEFPVGTPPRGKGEPTLQTPHGMQQSSSSVTTMTAQDPVPATPCQTSGGQPHFSRGDHHMYSHGPSASARTPQPVPSTSSLPLQGPNLQPQHSLDSHSARAPGYPPGINTSTPVTVPGGTDMSQMHYPGNPSFQSQHSRSTNGSYQGFPHESSSFSSVGSGGSTTSSSISSVSSRGSDQSYASSSAGYSQGSGHPRSTAYHPSAYTPGGPDLASVQHNREGYGSHSSADMATATGTPINLTYGPPSVTSLQFSRGNSMPTQRQEPLPQVVPAGNPPNPTTTSYQDLSSIPATGSPCLQPDHRSHTPPTAPHQCQEGVTSNIGGQPSEPSVPATEQQPRHAQVKRQDAIVPSSSEKRISIEEQEKSGSSQAVYYRLRGQSLEKGCNQTFRPILCKSYENLKTGTEKLTMKPPSETFVNPVFSSASGKFSTDGSSTYNSLFPEEAPERGKRTVILSDPGCGKTLLLTKAARDWAARKRLTKISLLLYIPMHMFASKTHVTLDDLLSLYYPDDTLQPEVARYVAACGGADVCFCFDGLKKRPPSIVAEILNGTQLPDAVVFVACQPEAIEFVETQASSVVRMERFGSEQVQAYTKSSLDSEHARVFLEYINSYPLLQQLCTVPLQLAIFMNLFNCNGSTTQLPDTDTKILEVLVLNLFWLSLSSQASPGSSAIDMQSFDQLPQQQQLAFDCLCSLAYNQILSSKNAFSCQDVQACPQVSIATIRSLCVSLIVCHRERTLTGLPAYRYSFSDPEVQAYFAALHLYRKFSTEQQEQAARDHARHRQLRSLWKFYCGIACKECPRAPPHDSFLKSFSTFVQHVINTSSAFTTGLELLPLFHCAFETRSPQACTILVEKLRGSISITRTEKLTRPDCFIIGYVICQSRCATSTLDFSESYLSSECIAALANQLEKARLEEISTLFLQGPIKAGDFEAATALMGFLSNLRNLQKLSLCNIQVKPSDQDALLQTVSQLQKLHTLRLSSSSLVPESGTKLAELLKNLKDLQELDLSYNPIGDQGLKDMSAGLMECDKLTILRLRECWFTEESGRTLAEILKRLPHLSDLELQGNRLQTLGVANMIPGLMNETCSLVNLNLMRNKIDDGGAMALMALNGKYTLKALKIDGNAIKPETTAILKQMKCILLSESS